MSRKLTYPLRRDRETEGQQPLFSSAAEDYADRMRKRYLSSFQYKRRSKKYPRSLYLFIVFCAEHELHSRAAWGIEELIRYYERLYGFLMPSEVGTWHLRLARARNRTFMSWLAEDDFLKGLSIFQANREDGTRDYLMGLRDLGRYYREQNKQELSDHIIITAYNKAVESRIGDPELLVRFQANVGVVHLAAQEYAEAAFHFGWALRRMRQSGLKSITLEVDIRKQYANALFFADALLRSAVQFQKVAELLNGQSVRNSDVMASIVLNQNRASLVLCIHAGRLVDNGDLLAALPFYERALRFYESMYQPNIDHLKEHGLKYATLLKDLGQDDESNRVHRRVLALLVKRLSS